MLNYNISLHGLENSLSTEYVEKIVSKKFSRLDNFVDKNNEIKVDLYKEDKQPPYKMTINGFLKNGQVFTYKERGMDIRNLIDEVCNIAKENIKEDGKRKFETSLSKKKKGKRLLKDKYSE